MTAVLPIEDTEEVATIHVLDRTGDTPVTWHKGNDTEIAVARAAFDKALEKKAAIFRVDKHGEKTSKTTYFDPEAEKYIVVPQMQGG